MVDWSGIVVTVLLFVGRWALVRALGWGWLQVSQSKGNHWHPAWLWCRGCDRPLVRQWVGGGGSRATLTTLADTILGTTSVTLAISEHLIFRGETKCCQQVPPPPSYCFFIWVNKERKTNPLQNCIQNAKKLIQIKRTSPCSPQCSDDDSTSSALLIAA